jgi:hypothetical protein
LVHVPSTERLKWKKYLVKVELENLTKLLFYDLKIPKERDSYVQFWKERTNYSLSQVVFCRTNPSLVRVWNRSRLFQRERTENCIANGVWKWQIFVPNWSTEYTYQMNWVKP